MDAGLKANVVPDVLAHARARYRAIENINIDGTPWRAFDTGGDNRALVLLPGSLGTAEIFCRQIVEFSESCRAIAIDYPDLPPAKLAADFVALLERLGITQATVLGASLAGYWLQHVPASDRIERVVLASTFVDSDELAHHPLFNIAKLKSSTGAAVKAEWLDKLEAQPPGELRNLQLELLRNGQDDEILRQRLLAAACAAPSPVMPLDPRRIAVVACHDDPLLSERTRNGLFARYPSAAQLYLPSGGHYPHVTQYLTYNQFLRRFMSLDDVERGGV
jgi:pimeloyl-ACP methyl ester carboxylesterase